MRNDIDLEFSREFKLGNDRLVLVKPGQTQGKKIEGGARNRLEKIFSSLKKETYTVRKAQKKEFRKLNDKIDLKSNLQKINFDKSLSKITRRLSSVIEDYRKKRGKIRKTYESITQENPLTDAKLYQGGEKRFEIERTTEFLSSLIEKEIKVNRILDKIEADLVDSFVKATIQHVGKWKENPYDIRKLKKRDYYKIIVCSDKFISNYLDKLVQVISDGCISSLGTRLKILPGSAILIEGSGFQNKLEIRIPIDLEKGLHFCPFRLTFKE